MEDKKPCNPENMLKFYRALRSGEYAQGRNTLRQTDDDGKGYKYCCLGVATQLAVNEGAQAEANDDGGDVWDQYAFLPPGARGWLGIEDTNPLLTNGDGEMMRAASANDSYRQDFEEIAGMFWATYFTPEMRDTYYREMGI